MSIDISEITHAVTKRDIRALRECDSLYVSFHRGETALRCLKRVENPGPFDEDKREYRIVCERSEVTKYVTDDGEQRKDREWAFTCSACVDHYKGDWH